VTRPAVRIVALAFAAGIAVVRKRVTLAGPAEHFVDCARLAA
jgi:hypothetical protein